MPPSRTVRITRIAAPSTATTVPVIALATQTVFAARRRSRRRPRRRRPRRSRRRGSRADAPQLRRRGSRSTQTASSPTASAPASRFGSLTRRATRAVCSSSSASRPPNSSTHTPAPPAAIAMARSPRARAVIRAVAGSTRTTDSSAAIAQTASRGRREVPGTGRLGLGPAAGQLHGRLLAARRGIEPDDVRGDRPERLRHLAAAPVRDPDPVRRGRHVDRRRARREHVHGLARRDRRAAASWPRCRPPRRRRCGPRRPRASARRRSGARSSRWPRRARRAARSRAAVRRRGRARSRTSTIAATAASASRPPPASSRPPARRRRAAGAERRAGGSSAGSCRRICSWRRVSRRAGLDPELGDERAARVRVGGERLGLPAAAVEREHQLSAEALAQRLARDLPLQLADHVGVPAEREVGVDPALERHEPLLLEPRALRLRPGMVGELAERRAAPQRQRVAQRRRRALGVVGGQRAAAVLQAAARTASHRSRRRPATSSYAWPRVRSRSPAGSPRRSCETRFCTTLAAVAGAAPSHSSSTIRSADTGRLRSTTRSASSSRWRPPPSVTDRPSSRTSSGPRMRMSIWLWSEPNPVSGGWAMALP